MAMTNPTARARRPRAESRAGELALARERWSELVRIARRHGVRRELAADVVPGGPGGGAAVVSRVPTSARRSIGTAARSVQNQAAKVHRRFARKEAQECPCPNPILGTEPRRRVRWISAISRRPTRSSTCSRARRIASGARDLLSLPITERAVLVLRAVGIAPREIAALLGISHRSVRKRITRANRLLRDCAR